MRVERFKCAPPIRSSMGRKGKHDSFSKRFPPVEDLEVEAGQGVREIVDRMRTLGFNAGKVHRAAKIWLDAARDPEVRIYFTLAGAMVPAGMRRVVAAAIDAGAIDVLATTGANMVHDGLQGFAGAHLKGTEHADDAELRSQRVLRVYDIFIPLGPFDAYDEWLRQVFLPALAEDHGDKGGEAIVAPSVILRELGRYLANEVGDRGILATAYRKRVPIYCPAFMDCNYGIVLDLANRTNLKERGLRLRVDQTMDFGRIIEDMAGAKERAVVVVGGGSPKNYVFQTSEALCEDAYHTVLGLTDPPKGFRHAVQLTTDAPHWGGLSGATLDEAISWRKMDPTGDRVTVYSDATIVLPLVVQYVVDELAKSRS